MEYNVAVRKPPDPAQGPRFVSARHTETLGLVLIALLILAITLARFGRVLHWSLR